MSAARKAPSQFQLLGNAAITLTSSQTTLLQQALAGANDRVTTLLGRSDRSSLLTRLFGRAGTAGSRFNSNLNNLFTLLGGAGLGLRLELRSSSELNGASVAYAPNAPGGGARVYLNAALLSNGTTAEQISWLLLKGLGHDIDARLNDSLDSPGDEGKAFAAALTGRSLTAAEEASLGRDPSGGVVNIAGTAVAVEVEANQGPTLSATASNGTFTEGQGLGSQGAPVAVFSHASVSVGGASEAWQTITAFVLSISGVRDGSSERLIVDGSSIPLSIPAGVIGSGSTAGSFSGASGLAWSLSGSGGSDGSGTVSLSFRSSAGISAAAMAELINAIRYQNLNTDNPSAGSRTITLTSLSDSGGTSFGGGTPNGGSDTSTPNITSTITVVAVNDAPQLGTLAGINLIDTAAQDSFTATAANNSLGSLSASDPEGQALSYSLSGATALGAAPASFDGLSYDLSKAGSYGTLYLNSSTGAYRFQPRSDWQLNALSSSGTDSFELSVTDGDLTTSSTLLVNFTGSNEAPEQYVLVDDGSPVLSTDGEALWEKALTNASRYLSDLLSNPNREQLLQDVFGNAGTDPAVFAANLQELLNTIGGTGLQIEVDLRTDAELNGAFAAYAAVGHTGTERIYVNG
ncbi:MAG: Ig-like domain-containing protein, partial [Synechococcaceae cyanobacterium]|nr:Ig-like domain-containing protein [Synechococcaceae cyanobacterium]